MKRWLRRKLINLLVRHLFRFVTVDDILVQKRDGFYLGDRKIEMKFIKELKGQADIILDMEVYQLVRKELMYVADKRMFDSSVNYDDMMFGKAMLYCLDLIHQKFTKLSSL
jgi:hypothetical protein